MLLWSGNWLYQQKRVVNLCWCYNNKYYRVHPTQLNGNCFSGEMSACTSPVLNLRVRISVRFKIRIRFRVTVGMVFRDRVWLLLSIYMCLLFYF